MTGPALQRKVSEGLRDAARKLVMLEIPNDEKERFRRRLIAVTNAAKRDLRLAAKRVAALLEDLEKASR